MSRTATFDLVPRWWVRVTDQAGHLAERSVDDHAEVQALMADPQVVYVEFERFYGAHLAGRGLQREPDHDDRDGHAIRVAAYRFVDCMAELRRLRRPHMPFEKRADAVALRVEADLAALAESASASAHAAVVRPLFAEAWAGAGPRSRVAEQVCRAVAELRTAVEDAGCDPRGEYRLVA